MHRLRSFLRLRRTAVTYMIANCKAIMLSSKLYVCFRLAMSSSALECLCYTNAELGQ